MILDRRKIPFVLYFLTGMISGVAGSLYAVIIAKTIGVKSLVLVEGMGSFIALFFVIIASKYEIGCSMKKCLVFYTFGFVVYDIVVLLTYFGVLNNPFPVLVVGNAFIQTAAVKTGELFETISMYQYDFSGRAKFTSRRTFFIHFGQAVGASMLFLFNYLWLIVFVLVNRVFYILGVWKLKDRKINGGRLDVGLKFSKSLGIIFLMYLALVTVVLLRGVYVESQFGKEYFAAYMVINYLMFIVFVPYGVKFVTSRDIEKTVGIMSFVSGLLILVTRSSPPFLAVAILASIVVLNVGIWGLRHSVFRAGGRDSTHGVIFVVYFLSLFAKTIMSIPALLGVSSVVGFLLVTGFILVVVGVLLLR